MADTARTFRITQEGLIPTGPSTFLDATSPTNGTGKIAFPTTSTVVIPDAATKLKNSKPVVISRNPVGGKPKKRKTLMPLEKWNLAREHSLVGPQKNGIACPSCGEELYDMDEPCFSNTFGTYLRIACYCGWSGDRRA